MKDVKALEKELTAANKRIAKLERENAEHSAAEQARIDAEYDTEMTAAWNKLQAEKAAVRPKVIQTKGKRNMPQGVRQTSPVTGRSFNPNSEAGKIEMAIIQVGNTHNVDAIVAAAGLPLKRVQGHINWLTSGSAKG